MHQQLMYNAAYLHKFVADASTILEAERAYCQDTPAFVEAAQI